MAYKSGFVTIIGRPNVGKSTLLNKILGQKVVITSSKPQTTRRRIKGIHTTEKGQIIFVDTPGIHKPHYKLGEYLLDEVKLSMPEADLILFLVDGSELPGRGDQWIVENILQEGRSVILIINKIDTIKDKEKRDKIVEGYKALFEGKSVPTIKVSAKTGKNVNDLVDNIYRKLPKGPQYYTDEELTDQNMRSISSEIIREKILHKTRDEVPHSVAVLIDKFEEKDNIANIMATIYVEHDSQKGIVIGKGGEMLKIIGSEARKEIEELVEKKVFLELFVKVEKNWRKKPSALKQFGYVSE